MADRPLVQAADAVVIVPVFNHHGTLEEVVRGVLSLGLAVIVVDDGSSPPVDLKDMEAAHPGMIRTVRHPENMGKGAAILTGLAEAARQGYRYAVTLDADGQHHPEDIPLLLDRAGQTEGPSMVIGARSGMEREDVPAASRFGMRFSNFWVYLETGLEIPDTQSGFRLYPVQEVLALDLSCRRYDFEIEVLVKGAWAGIRIESVSVSCSYPPPEKRISHFHKFLDNLRLSILHTRLVARRLVPFSRRLNAASSKAHDRKGAQGLVHSCFSAFRHPIRLIKEISTQHSSPGLLAAAAWLGLFMGALPLIACHTVAIIYVAHRWHLNKVAAVGASQFCCPPLVPVICVEAGHFMLHGRLLTELTMEQLALELHLRLYEWLVGSLVVGPVLGAAGAAVVYFTARRLKGRGREEAGEHALQ